MSSLLEFLQKERKLNWKFWFNYYHQWLLGLIYNKNTKQDNSWKGVKIAKTITPEGWTSKNCFKFLGEEYSGKIMKAYKD